MTNEEKLLGLVGWMQSRIDQLMMLASCGDVGTINDFLVDMRTELNESILDTYSKQEEKLRLRRMMITINTFSRNPMTREERTLILFGWMQAKISELEKAYCQLDQSEMGNLIGLLRDGLSESILDIYSKQGE